MSAGERVLRDDGYRFVVPIATVADDFDAQGHLNNAATVRLFNDLRVAYVRGEVGFDGSRPCAATRSWSRPRKCTCCTRRRVSRASRSSAGCATSAARARPPCSRNGWSRRRPGGRSRVRWVVQLLVQDGSVVEWPDLYFVRVAEIEGREIPVEPRRHTPWGPPP